MFDYREKEKYDEVYIEIVYSNIKYNCVIDNNLVDLQMWG